MRLAFIGMMGAGKSAVAKEVASRLFLDFADLDDMLVYRFGMPIAQVFITFGEDTFRRFETNVLKEVVWRKSIVIACGGGVALGEENMVLLKDYVKIRLTASPDVIFNRIKDDFMRPLIKDNSPPALKRIIESRETSYARHADFTLDTDNLSIKAAADEVLKIINTYDKG